MPTVEEEGARDVYTPSEAERILARTGKPLTERRIRQMLQAGELEGYRDGTGRWHVLQSEVHRLRDQRLRELERPSGATESGAELLEVVRSLEREIGRLEGRLELEERTESTLREERDRLRAELEEERAERRRLAERLEAEQRRGFWSRLFGGA
jgi:septal ring factor EnvC (AmiA/AmiB activator)